MTPRIDDRRDPTPPRGDPTPPRGERGRLRRLAARDMETLRPGERRGWWLREALDADPGEPCPPPSRDATADVVIVGGGYTGLWTSWWLTEHAPDARVVILEADIVGGGASGRNGGFLTGWWDALPSLVHHFGVEPALATVRAVAAAPVRIGEWAAEHGVDAWFTPGGSILAATSPAQDGAWSGIVELATRLGEADRFRELSAGEVRARCDSPTLRGGLFVASDATVQPARLARGLRRVLLGRGVAIHEGTRATGLRPEGDRVRLTTDTGATITAAHAILGLNAWAAGWPGGGFGARMITWSSYMVLTEPIPDRLAAIGWTGGEGISDCRFTNHYARTTRDGRIAFGGGGGRAGYGGRLGDWVTGDRGSTALAARGFRRIFPMLDDVALADAWGGPIDISPDHLPSFGTSGDGRIHWGHGYSGNGVGASWVGGQVLAALAQRRLDDPNTRLPLVGHRARPFPPEPFRYLGARVIREAIVEAEQRDDAGGYVPPPLRWLVRLPRVMGYDLGAE
jgi:glycine/D-amino acid oxidase-like deaminating enzyme